MNNEEIGFQADSFVATHTEHLHHLFTYDTCPPDPLTFPFWAKLWVTSYAVLCGILRGRIEGVECLELRDFLGLDTEFAICDTDLNILHVDASFGGAAHDSFVWNQSPIKEYVEELHNNGEHCWLLEITIPLRNNSSPERIGFVYPADALITTMDNIMIVSSSKKLHKSDLYLIPK